MAFHCPPLTEMSRIAAVTAFLAAQTLEPPYSDAWVDGAELFTRFGLPAKLP